MRPGWLRRRSCACVLPSCLDASLIKVLVLTGPVALHTHFPCGVELPTYTHDEMEAYSCVAGDVACNSAPAVPSPADAWSGTVNNP